MKQLNTKPSSKSTSGYNKTTVYKQINKQSKNQVEDEMTGLSLDDSLYFVGDIIQTWSSLIIAGCGLDDNQITEGRPSNSSHPLSALLCGNLTGFTAHGLELMSIISNIYEVTLPRILKGFKQPTANQSVSTYPSSSTQKHTSTRLPLDENAVSKVIAGLRKCILQVE